MAMTRREIREHIFRLLFDLEYYAGEDRDEQVQLYFELVPEEEGPVQSIFASDEDRAYITDKTMAIAAKIPEIDAAVNAVAKGWKTGRMARADLTIIRIAVYEILFDESIPTGVAINEAVELAKTYGADSSPAFVNGVLARLVQEEA